jgi:hypothetical protein
VGQFVALSLTAALNPTLIAAVTVMMLLPQPRPLMVGYLAGALLMSVSIGLVVVFALHDSSTAKTTQHTLSPLADIALGTLAFAGGMVLSLELDRRLAARRRRGKEPKPDKGPPRWRRVLSEGSARQTFVVGALLTLPGASYLAGLHELNQLGYSPPARAAAVVGFNLVMLLLIELPLLGFVFAPDWTPGAIEGTKLRVGRHGRRVATIGLLALGAALVLKGLIGLAN